MILMAPAELPENPADVRAPLEDAFNQYKKMRSRGGWRRLDREGRVLYFFFMQHRNFTRNWRRRQKQELHDKMEKGLRDCAVWLEKANAFADWFDTQAITEERYIHFHGSIEGSETREMSGGTISVKRSDAFESKARVHRFFANKVREAIEEVQDSYDSFDMDDPDFGLSEQIAAAGHELGLELYDPYNDRDDGAVYLVDPETDRIYYFALAWFHTMTRKWTPVARVSVLDERYRHDRWKDVCVAPLNRTAMNVPPATYPDYMRVFRDHFGMFDSIEYMIDVDNSPVPFP